ncbi:MAG: class I SAM-dependent methyltransferase [Nostocoides sp.]
MNLRDQPSVPRVSVCRSCSGQTLVPVLDLGEQPACDYFPIDEGSELGPASGDSELDAPADPRWPLGLVLCTTCGLVQLSHRSPAPEEPLAVESASVRAHAQQVTAAILERLGRPGTFVEFASAHGGSWADAMARSGVVQAPPGSRADLVLDNHSIIHAEDIDAQFARRVQALAPAGVLVVEFHHVLDLVRQVQFDAVRHGHPVYLSLRAWQALCARHGLVITDAWHTEVYGGCLVVMARPAGTGQTSPSVEGLLAEEADHLLHRPEGWEAAQEATRVMTGTTRQRLEDARAGGQVVLGYGAGSKSVTFLGVAGIDHDLLAAVADASPAKQGRRIPGTSIPIVSPSALASMPCDEVLILTWDIADEVAEQLRSMGMSATFHPVNR